MHAIFSQTEFTVFTDQIKFMHCAHCLVVPARRLCGASRRLAGACHFRLVACVRYSEIMQRAVWRKNSDTFYVAIEKRKKEKKLSLGCKTLPKRLKIDSFGTERTVCSALKGLKMTAMGQ